MLLSIRNFLMGSLSFLQLELTCHFFPTDMQFNFEILSRLKALVPRLY